MNANIRKIQFFRGHWRLFSEIELFLYIYLFCLKFYLFLTILWLTFVPIYCLITVEWFIRNEDVFNNMGYTVQHNISYYSTSVIQNRNGGIKEFTS